MLKDKDKRKSARRRMRYTAWIALKPGELHGCVLFDISASGARMQVEDAKTIPDHFLLWLSGNGKAKRKCGVVWRNARQIGVRFERPFAAGDRAALVPTLDTDMDTAKPATEPAESA
jgi:PilZ domain